MPAALSTIQVAYWYTLFAAVVAWGGACIVARLLSRRRYPARALLWIQTATSAAGMFTLMASPWALRVGFLVPATFVVAVGLAVTLVPRLVPRGTRLFYQLRNVLSWFALAALFATFGATTRQGIWFIGGAIFLAASLWNVYAEFVLKPAIQEFYSDVDDQALWSGPLLPEESPIIVMCLASLAHLPGFLGMVPAATLRGLAASLDLPLSVSMTGFILAAIGIALARGNDLRRFAASRACGGIALLIALLWIVLKAASGLSNGLVHFGADVAHGTVTEVLALSLWTGALALLLGIVPLVFVLISVVVRAHEYDLFLSFATADRLDAQVIARCVEGADLRLFFSDESIMAGEEFRDRIRKAIRNSCEVAVLASPRSLVRKWVHDEYTLAWGLEKPLTPVLRDCSEHDLPEPLRGFQSIPFERVADYVRDLSARVRKPAPLTIVTNARRST